MSFTACYSPLYALDADGDRLDRAPKLLDREGLLTFAETRSELGRDTMQSLMVTKEWTDPSTSAPKETWELLRGFKTHTPAGTFMLDFEPDAESLYETITSHRDRERGPLGYRFNVERIGIPYEGVDGLWQSFFRGVSEHTEPFAVFHSPIAHRFPDVTDFDGGKELVYYIEADNGALYAEERRFERTETEVIVDDAE